jgi:uncharacterized membrane protein
MVLASRLQRRLPWVAGASLLGVVVVKLFFIDLAHLSSLSKIVSFLGVGMLLVLIGYLSPAPPKALAQAGAEGCGPSAKENR